METSLRRWQYGGLTEETEACKLHRDGHRDFTEEMAMCRPPPGVGLFMEDAAKTFMAKGLAGKGMAPQRNSTEERMAM